MTKSELHENLAAALAALRARPVRSALTILGIVIGVTSVISVAAIIDGLNRYIRARIETLGSRSLFIMRIPAGFGAMGRLPEKIRLRKYLQPTDAAYLKETVPALSFATVFANRVNFGEQADELRYGNEHVERIFIRGVEPDYTYALPLFLVAEGRFVSQYDLDHSRNVIVIGHAIADSLFPNLDPIGKVVRLNGRPYEVIGIFAKDPGLFGGMGVDQFACVPFTTFRKNNPEIREMFIMVAVREDADLDAARNQLIEALRRRRRVPHSGENDFEVTDASFFTGLWNQLTGAMAILTGIISSVGLLVGGIGVMNIMLISVTERTAEIGLRKAIGARRSDIRAQFLLEAITLSGIGGIIGILLGAMISFAVRSSSSSIPATLSVFWIFMGVALSVSVGLFFGYYPANRAAALDPIVCLRYE